MIRIIATGFDRIERVYGHAAAASTWTMANKLVEHIPEYQSAAVDAIQTVTEDTHSRSGALAESTQSTDPVFAGLSADFDIIQPAESDGNLDGSGGGFEYVQMVLPPDWTDGPERRVITAPSDGEFSNGKKAFAGPDFGPVKSYQQFAGDPYPLLADPTIDSAYTTISVRYSEDVFRTLLEMP